MALGEEGGGGIPATMLVGPANVGNGMAYPYPVFGGMGMGGGSGMGSGFGNDGGWIVLLLIIILVAAGGWGNNGNGGFSGQPIVVNEGGGYGAVQRGFDQAAVMAALSGIQGGICSGFSDVQMALCGGFAGVNATVNNGVNTITQQLYANTIADMQNSFAMQSKFADCCCENRLGIESLRATVLSENCADRYEAANNTRDIITALTSGIQSIKDEICADRLEGYKRENDALRTQLNMANLNASQIAQTSQITDSVYNRLATCPVGTVPVYGEQAIFRCNNNNGCGCGCGGNGF